MPLVRFELRNEFALGKPELYSDVIEREEEPKAVLDAVAVSGLVGILRQLGDLAEFAAEVFHGLQEQVVITASKSRKLMVRVQHLEAKLPPIEKAVLAQTSHIHFAYTAGCEWHTRIWNERNQFINDDLPRFIMDSYEECRHPPNLHLLDKFDAGGPGSCLKRYSDPSYFKRVSGNLGESNSGILQQDGKSHKIKKKRSSRKNKEISRATSLLNRSGRMQFTASINDHTYPQRTSELDETIKYDRGRHSYSFDSRSESRHNEYVSRLSFKLQPEDQEYRKSSLLRPMHQHDEVNSISSDQETGMGDEYFSHGTLPEPRAPSPSSVTWEEKTEIMEPLQYIIDEVPDILYTDSEIHLQEKVDAANLPKVDEVDIVQDDVLKLKPSEIQCTNPELHLQKYADPQNDDHIDIPKGDAHTLTTVSGKYQNDEVESDQDDFMDALNTIESESENELDCQSISKVSRYSSDVNEKVTEESTKEHMLHCPDNHTSSMELDCQSILKVSRYSSGVNEKVTEESTKEHMLHCPDNHASSMELDCQSISKVSRYTSGVNDKVTEESTKEYMLHWPDNHPSSMEPNISSDVLADSVTHKNVGHSPDNYPSNMESNGGSHILSNRDSPEHLCNDEDVGHSPDHQPSSMEPNISSDVLADSVTHKNVGHSADNYPSNMESNGGSLILSNRDSPEHLCNDEDVGHSPDHQPSSMEPNISSDVLADSVTHKNVGHSADNYPSNMESNGGSHILTNRDSPEHLCNDEDVRHSPAHQPSDFRSYTGTQVLVDEDDNELVVHIPHHYAFNMESSGGSHTFADSDGHEHLYADEQAIHSPEYHPSNMESNGGYHVVVHTDAYEQMVNSPKHYLSNTELDITSCASTEKDAHGPEHRAYNVESDAVSHSCSDGDFHLVPFSYGFPNSGYSSCDLPNSVSSQSYSKEKMSQITEKSSDLVKSSGLKSCDSSSVPDDTGDPGVTNPPYSESRISNLPEATGDDNKSKICESQETVSDSKSCQAVRFWTNGSLLGLQPSKPPDFAVVNSGNQDSLENSKEERYGTLNENHMSRFDGRRRSVAAVGENAKTLRNSQIFASSAVCSEDQTNDINFKEELHSDGLADSSSTLTISGQFSTNSYADAQIKESHVTSAWTLGTDAALAPGINSLSTDANQEMDGKSSQSFGLGQRLLLSGFRRKFPPVHNDTSELLRIVQDSMPKQCSRQQNFTYHRTPDRPYREPFKCESIQRSPSSSPPVEHMKISFRPVNTFETSSLKLKIMDGGDCHETGNTFSSFQLVPEHTAPLHDIFSDSDDDTFCPSSPCMSDEDGHSSHPSDSNSEQWESGENIENKDEELYNSLLRRISSEDSASGSSELGGMVTNINQVDGGITDLCRENDMEHAFSSPLLDLPDFSSMNYIVKCTAKDGCDAKDLLELQLPRETAPIPPPLPPAPGKYVFSGTGDNAQHSVSKALRAFDLKIGGSSISSQSKRNLLEKEANGKASLLGSKIKEQNFNGQKEADNTANGKGMNEREDFLHQIRTKSFSLRPTVTAKAIVTPVGSTNVSITAILEKANAIRRAVGSDGGEDYDTWSDT